MSRTVTEAIGVTRYHLRDRDDTPAFTAPEYTVELQSQVRSLAAELLLGEEVLTPFVTTVANTPNYPLPGTQEYANIYSLRSQIYGLNVPVVSRRQFDALRQGYVSPLGNGVPRVAMFREGATQAIEIVFWPVPNGAYPMDAYRSLLPAAFYQAGTFVMAALPGDTVIPFDDYAFEGLCYRTADQLFKRMTDVAKAKNRLAPTAAEDWPGLAQMLIKASRRRRIATTARSDRTVRSRRW